MDSQRSSELSNRTKLSYQTIAQRSGLSISTVSRVFNKSASVSEEKRERVVRALQQLLREDGVEPAHHEGQPQPIALQRSANLGHLCNPFAPHFTKTAGLALFREDAKGRKGLGASPFGPAGLTAAPIP